MPIVKENAPSVACLRCRKQKLRCTRELPVCQRCQRVKAECSYPPPPDRRRLTGPRIQSQSEFRQPSSSAQAHNDPRERPFGEAAAVSSTLGARSPKRAVPSGSHSQQVENDATFDEQSRRTGQFVLGIPTPGDMTILPPPSRPLHDINLIGVQQTVEISREVSSFLIEIYFERHYQAHLLFSKHDFAQSYHAGKVSSQLTLAVFAFASMFLSSTLGGITEGNIDIGEVSKADWSSIGHLWAEKASQLALARADKPCLELIQTCQILALFWFAKSKTVRTNMHTTIAYRACQLLQFDRVVERTATHDSSQRHMGMRCFWACWLTKCASQENSRFQVDCWADVVALPLPEDKPDTRFMSGSSSFLDKLGMVQDLGSPNQGSFLGFHSSLIVIQGIWWEIQQLARMIRRNQGSPSAWASTFCSLDEKLESLANRMGESSQNSQGGHGDSAGSCVGLGHIFSLNYLRHFCAVFLHSSVVPVLSCGLQAPAMSQSMLRLAAEQAYQHSERMTAMTEQYLSDCTAVSKLWPVVGYGAYVCAAVQLRRLLVLEQLTVQGLDRLRVHLRITSELKQYWSTLGPLYDDMERQFSQAQKLISHEPRRQDRDELMINGNVNDSRLIATPKSGEMPEFSHQLGTYVENDDLEKSDDVAPHSPVSSSIIGASFTAEASSNAQDRWDQSSAGVQIRSPRITEQSPTAGQFTMGKYSADYMLDVSLTRQESMWWNRDPQSLSGVFGTGFFLDGDYDLDLDAL